MNPWMKTLERALDKEGVFSRPDLARLVPHQYYGETVAELLGQLKGYLAARSLTGKGLAVFVDGVAKQCSEAGGTTIDPLFRDALSTLGVPVDWVVLSERLGIAPPAFHASFEFVEKTREVVRTLDPSVAVVLGSGSITDVVKHALFLEKLEVPLISVPTALTVTAFTSAFSIVDYHGAKRTQLSREVAATFWLRSVLECAPPAMSRAGYGDLLARFLAYGDWYLGKALGVMDRYDELAFRLMEPFVAGIRESADGFASPIIPGPTIECIAAALAMAGIAMSVSGETTPLSGFEHVISHGLDFLHLTAGRELVFHGEQVALGCLTSARVFDWLVEQGHLSPVGWIQDPEREGLAILNSLIDRAPLPPGYGDKVEKARAEFVREYEKKARRWKEEMAHLTGFIDGWPKIRAHLAEITMRLAELEVLARRAGLPLTPGDTVPPTTEEELRWAVSFSPFVRVRMNVSDLLFWMGKSLPEFIYKPV